MDTGIENRVKQAVDKIDNTLSSQLSLAFKYSKNDPSGSLGKSRTVLEKLILEMFVTEMGKEPKKKGLGGMLNDNQFTRKIDRRILALMNAAKDMGNLGAHGDDVVTEDAERSLIDLCKIIDWQYHYKKNRGDSAHDVTIKQLTNEAETFARNGLYTDALRCWEKIRTLDPNNHTAEKEILSLQKNRQEKQKIKHLRTQLSRRMKDIRPIFNTVVKRLNKLSDTDDDETLLVNIEMFVNQELSAEDFIENWQMLTRNDSHNKIKPSITIDYQALAGRIQRGEFVLFLGSGIIKEYNAQPLSDTEMAQQLAKNVAQQALQLPLSSIAEYYDLRNDYGRPFLLRELHNKLPKKHQSIQFYSSLAQLQRPLMLISSAYDDLLEQAFDQYHKPYVELASIINRSHQYDIGNLVLRYSDTDEPAISISEESLSSLNLLEQGYSIIYKIRGTCRPTLDNDNSLTLMESDYFRFARYAERIIPSYIAKQFLTHAFLLLACQPQQWEDRLILNTLLEKRGGSGKNCLMLGNCSDDFETAYWIKRNVTQHAVSIRHLDRYLKKTA